MSWFIKLPWLVILSTALYLSSILGVIMSFLLDGPWLSWTSISIMFLVLSRIESLINGVKNPTEEEDIYDAG